MLRSRNNVVTTAAIAALILFGVSGTTVAADSETYTWSAELVAFDEASRMVTVRSRMVGYETGDPASFDEGDRIVITWSGLSTATGVRSIAHGDAVDGRLTLPAELAGLEGRYLTFRVPIPADSVDAISALEPGDWITATSRQPVSDPSMAVLGMRGFNDVEFTNVQ